MPTPDVSVVVPVYNTEPYLRACLDSVVGQTLGPERVELVAVDDGSTDGSGALLDEYAAAYPSCVTVVHQENSGGPARPCNVGLELATGRFVFFLGSDDYLALDALERMVERADAWGADVVVPVMEGVNGRHVDQRLFEEEQPDVAFPGSLLPYSLSNTKLFRRALVEEHGIRYPLDLRVGSDQPFTIAAMTAASRIGVMSGATSYFAVKREAEDNITYRFDWRAKLDDIVNVIDHVAEVVPAGDDRDAILERHFHWELGKLVRHTLPAAGPEERAELVERLGEVADRYLTDGLSRRLGVAARLRWWLVRHGRADDVVALLARDDNRSQIHVDEAGLFLAQPGFRDGVPDEVFRPTVDGVLGALARAFADGAAALDGTALEVSTSLGRFEPVGAPHVTFVLSRLPGPGYPRQGRVVDAGELSEPALAATAEVLGGDRLGATLDLRPLLSERGSRWSLRMRVDARDRVYDLPVRSDLALEASVRHRLRTLTLRISSTARRRVVVSIED